VFGGLGDAVSKLLPTTTERTSANRDLAGLETMSPSIKGHDTDNCKYLCTNWEHAFEVYQKLRSGAVEQFLRIQKSSLSSQECFYDCIASLNDSEIDTNRIKISDNMIELLKSEEELCKALKDNLDRQDDLQKDYTFCNNTNNCCKPCYEALLKLYQKDETVIRNGIDTLIHQIIPQAQKFLQTLKTEETKP
jgi:hypothetical protein